MSKFSEYVKSVKEKDLKFFFGDDVEILQRGESVRWNHVKSDDEIIIATSNVKYWKNKDQFVLVVANNKCVYLKNWQVKHIKNWDLQQNAYAVKLSRKYFKAYTMPFDFDGMSFEKEDDFDSLLEVAMAQNDSEIVWKLGHYDCI